jgi:FkbM family methyltransferase
MSLAVAPSERVRSLLRRAWTVLPEEAKALVRANDLYRRLSHFAYPHRKNEFDGEKIFFDALFRSLGLSPRLIFDIGANCGEKTQVFVALGASVVAVEPTPKRISHLQQRFKKKRVTIERVAVSSVPGTATLWCVKGFDAMNTISLKNRDVLSSGVNPRTPDRSKPEIEETITVATTTLDQLIAKSGRPDYIKIDTEGHDREVIQGLSTAVPLLSFEANLPEFASESIDAIDHLFKLSVLTRFQARGLSGALILPHWASAEEVKTLLLSDKRYMEIFATTAS